jgi:SHS family sialic acid transporter-like MFS transporter
MHRSGSFGRNAALAVALLGWLFDGFEMGLFPLIGGLQTATLMAFFGGSFPKAGSVLVAIYLVGAVLVWLGPETKGRPLPA